MASVSLPLVFSYLLDLGADVHAKNPKGKTVLHFINKEPDAKKAAHCREAYLVAVAKQEREEILSHIPTQDVVRLRKF